MAAVDKAFAAVAGGAGSTIVVALSGGPDSTALLDALAALRRRWGLSVVAAHLDHGLRPDSKEDARFCRELCRRLRVPLRRGRADVRERVRREGCGLEDAARRERYAFLEKVRDEERASLVAVAHTRDDQAETLLLRLLRGAGRVGLSAMRKRRGRIVRPLLGVSRAEVVAYLESRGLAWREDSTNADPAHLRNRVRHELLPYLEARFQPRIREVLARTAGLLSEEAALLNRRARLLLARASRRDRDGLWLSRERLAAAPRPVARLAVRRALARAGGLRGVQARHLDGMIDLASRQTTSGRCLPLPGGRAVTVCFGELRVARRTSARAPFAYPLAVPGRVELPGGLAVETEAAGRASKKTGTLRVAVPPGEALQLRTRRPGDRVFWRGRPVSLKRFLMEARVPAEERSSLPLVAAGTRVVWVSGTALDERAGDRFIGLRMAGATRVAPGGGR
jgi:tRNA(Ile)-lysidine synthase